MKRRQPVSNLPPIPAELVEALMEMRDSMLGVLPGPRRAKAKRRASTPEAQAIELLEQSDFARTAEEAHELAAKAYQLDPRQARALEVMSLSAASLHEGGKFKEAEVELRSQQIPPEDYENVKGQLWLLLEARPYLNALRSLANLYRQVNRRDDALDTLRKILDLNDNDNQGVRETLLQWYLDWGQPDAAWELLQRRDDGFITAQFTTVLLRFRREGDSPALRKLLTQAKKANKHVTGYLLGDVVLQEHRGDSIMLGGKDEAQVYAQYFRIHWVNTPRALAWLKEQTTPRKRKKTGTGPLPITIEAVRRLPQCQSGWVVDYRQIPHFVKNGSKLHIAWCLVVLDTETGLLLGTQLFLNEPALEEVWDYLVDVMQRPTTRELESHRPYGIIGLPRETLLLLRPHLQALDIQLVTQPSIEPLEELYEDLTHAMCREDLEMPALSKIEGVSENDLEQFHQSATDYFRQAPWLWLGHERTIRVVAPWIRPEPFYAIILGRLGITPGISCYYDADTVKSMLGDGPASNVRTINEIKCLSLRFDYPHEMSAVNVLEQEKHGWAMPGFNLHPNLMSLEPGGNLVTPTLVSLHLLTALCEAAAAFVMKREQDDASPYEHGQGDRLLTLSWEQDVPAW